MDNEKLLSIGVLFNRRHKILICRTCEYAISHKTVYGHLIVCKGGITKSQVEEAMSEYRTSDFNNIDDVIDDSKEPRDLIDGLSVRKGFQCSSCLKCFGVKTSCLNHIRTKRCNGTASECFVQILRKHPQGEYFRIKDPTYIPESKEYASSFHAEILAEFYGSNRTDLSKDGINNVRARSFQISKLDDFNALESMSDEIILNALKAMNEPDARLTSVCEKYVRRLNTIINPENIYLRRIIERYGRSNAYSFTRIQTDHTLEHYSHVLKKIIAFMYHKGSALAINIIDKLNEDENIVMSKLYGAIFKILTQKLPDFDKATKLHLYAPILFLALKSNCARAPRPPDSTTKDLSGILFILKGTALMFLSSRDGNEVIPNEFAKEYLSQESQTNFDLVTQKKGLLSLISKQSPFLPRIQHDLLDPLNLRVDGKFDVSLSHIRRGIESITAKLEKEMSKILPDIMILPGIRDTMQDRTGVTDEGYSFMTEESNDLVPLSVQAVKNIFQKMKKEPSTLTDSDCENFLKLTSMINCDLLTAVHLTCGYPWRGPEYQSLVIQECDIANRSVILMPKEKRIVLLGRYSKNRNNSNTERVKPKMLNEKVSDILFRYLVYLRPMERIIAKRLNPDIGSLVYSTYLFVTNGNVVGDVSKILKYRLSANIGLEINISTWRHMMEAWLQPSPLLMGLDEEENDTVVDLMAGHSHATSVRYGFSDKDVQGMSSQLYHKFLMLSRKWHKMLEADEKPNSVLKKRKHLEDDNNSGTRVMLEDGDTIDAKEIVVANGNRNGKNFSFEDDQIIYCLQNLREAKGWDSFKSKEQKLATLYATYDNDNLLVILPTGGGKSLVYELAMRCRWKLTGKSTYGILVVPTNCIKSQAIRNMVNDGIHVELFNHDLDIFRNPYRKTDCTIIIIQPNMLQHTLFWSTIQKRQPSFVCIDECHLITEWTDFMHGYKYAYNFSTFRCPIWLLSATVPPRNVSKLLQTLGIDKIKEVRANTDRSNLKIKAIIAADESAKLNNLIENIEIFIKERNITDRCIINVQTIYQIEKIKMLLEEKLISATEYHGKLETSQQDSSSIAWERSIPIMICTKGFGLGKDYPYVTLVINYGLPSSLEQYDQDIGRGGRSGCPCDCLIIIEKNELMDENDKCNVMIKDLVQKKHCRRQFLKSYIDGTSLSCLNGVGKRTCDYCESRFTTATTPYVSEANKADNTIRERLIEWVKEFDDFAEIVIQEQCVIGYLEGSKCNHIKGDLSRCEHVQYNQCFRCLAEGHHIRDCPYIDCHDGVCYKCMLPLHLMGGYKIFHSGGYGKECSSGYANIINPYCWYLFHNEKKFLNSRNCPVADQNAFYSYIKEVDTGLSKAAWLLIDHWKSRNKVYLNDE